MSNLKYDFYKGYYNGADFRIDKNQVKEKNTALFRRKNTELENYKIGDENQSLNLDGVGISGYRSFSLKTTYPGLLIGSGYMHEMHTPEEIKLGFFFDHTTGLPILPGSSIKGVLRSAFPQFGKSMNPKFENATDKQKQKAYFIQELCSDLSEIDDDALFNAVHQLELAIFEGIDIRNSKNSLVKLPMSKRCKFFDAFISDNNKKIVGLDVLTPHKDGLKNPIPLPFLKVLPNITFKFQMAIQPISIDKFTISEDQIVELFTEIVLHFGMGAKTNVGYGQFVALSSQERYDAKVAQQTSQVPEMITPVSIAANTPNIIGEITEVHDNMVVFEFEYQNKSFLLTKSINSITKKWIKKGYEDTPKLGDMCQLNINRVLDDLVRNFSVSLPKKS